MHRLEDMADAKETSKSANYMALSRGEHWEFLPNTNPMVGSEHLAHPRLVTVQLYSINANAGISLEKLHLISPNFASSCFQMS